MALLFFLAGAISYGSAWGGWAARRRRHGYLSPILLGLLIVTILFAALGAYGLREPDVTGDRVATGMVYAVIGIGILPVLVFYTAGYLIPRTWILAVAWGVAIVPFAFYGFMALIVVADWAACTEDAHECPL